MSSKLFEEALADAKKLKEVAEENAKKAIIEAVTPKIRDFIESTLLEDQDKEVDEKHCTEDAHEEEEGEDVVLDENSLNSLISMLGGHYDVNNLMAENKTKTAFLGSIKNSFANLSEAQKKKILNVANKINQNADNLSSKRINNNVVKNEENSRMSNNKFYEVDLRALREAVENSEIEEGEVEEYMDEDIDLDMEEGDYMMEEDEDEGMRMDEEDEGHYDMHEEDEDEGMRMDEEEDDDLNELINEIKLELDLGDDIDEDALPEELRGFIAEDEEDEEEADLEEEEPEEVPEEGEEGEEGEFEPPELEEMYDVNPDMLREELRNLRRALREGNMDHHFGGKGSGKAGVKNSFGGSGKKNQGVKGAFGGGSYGSDPFTNPPSTLKKLNETRKKMRQLNRKNRVQQEKLNKYRGAISSLREQLEDLNLFNAKLLYVNKLLQNKSLTESQKKSVIKALDEAKDLREAKSLYKSLTETFSRGKGTLNESRIMGSSSRATTSASAKKATGEVNRWQRLAGLE